MDFILQSERARLNAQASFQRLLQRMAHFGLNTKQSPLTPNADDLAPLNLEMNTVEMGTNTTTTTTTTSSNTKTVFIQVNYYIFIIFFTFISVIYTPLFFCFS